MKGEREGDRKEKRKEGRGTCRRTKRDKEFKEGPKCKAGEGVDGQITLQRVADPCSVPCEKEKSCN